MTKWNFVTVAILGLALASAPAMAQDDEEEEDDYLGCDMLATGVGAALYFAGTATGANAWTVGASAALSLGIAYNTEGACDHVTEETIEAYENAMNNLRIQIQWHTYHDPFMPWCMSIREYDCIPYIEPGDLPPDPSQQLFVEQAWEVARFTAEQLANGGTANSAHISPQALASALQAGFERSGLAGAPSPFQNSFDGIE